jgi:hypothetical protein
MPIRLVRIYARVSALQTVQICARRKEFSECQNRRLLWQYSCKKTEEFGAEKLLMMTSDDAVQPTFFEPRIARIRADQYD